MQEEKAVPLLRGKEPATAGRFVGLRTWREFQAWGGCLCITVHPTAQGLTASVVHREWPSCGLLHLSLTLPRFRAHASNQRAGLAGGLSWLTRRQRWQ